MAEIAFYIYTNEASVFVQNLNLLHNGVGDGPQNLFHNFQTHKESISRFLTCYIH